jgi:hypothetical protein
VRSSYIDSLLNFSHELHFFFHFVWSASLVYRVCNPIIIRKSGVRNFSRSLSIGFLLPTPTRITDFSLRSISYLMRESKDADPFIYTFLPQNCHPSSPFPCSLQRNDLLKRSSLVRCLDYSLRKISPVKTTTKCAFDCVFGFTEDIPTPNTSHIH